MSLPGAYNALYTASGGYAGRSPETLYGHRPLTSPSPNSRRVIFPSLHGASSPSQPQRRPRTVYEQPFLPSSNEGCFERPKSEGVPSPTEVGTNIDGMMKPVLVRANSLDGISIPFPKLSLNDGGNSSEGLAPIAPRSLDQRVSVQVPNIPHASQSVHPSNWSARPPHGTSSSDAKSASKSKSKFFGYAQHKTYYPATSVPTPVSDKKRPTLTKPPVSILRRKTPCSPTTLTASRQGSTSRRSSYSPCESDTASASLDPGESALSPCLSPSVPTLASPSQIESLHARDQARAVDPQCKLSPDSGEGIGDSEYDLKRISDSPKVLPRKQCLGRIQSDTVVARNKEEEPRRDSITTSSSHDSVSRHASLECLSSKRISFDPHITVYEFLISNYEGKGGEKWFSEDELTQFKQEAIQRIRLRSMKVIPTGTGRALTVATKGNDKHNNEKGNGKGGRPGGSVMFNHPALGCGDDDDRESRFSKESAIKGHLSQEMRNILVVDPHEIFLALFTKSLKHMIPHASVATARSAEEAIIRIEAAQKAFPQRDGGSTHGFDIIIVEERLRSSSFSVQQRASGQHSSPTNASTQSAGDDSAQRKWNMASGSALIRHLAGSQHRIGEDEVSEGSHRCSLFVGVTSRMTQDQQKLKTAGADCVWGKPPPEMNSSLRNSLLELLMKKRRRANLELFE